MKHTNLLRATLLIKTAMAIDPQQQMQDQQPEDKFIKRRRMLARVLPALLMGLVGGTAGHGIGKTDDMINRATGEGDTNNAIKDMLIGGLGGGALGYGAGALKSNAREWAGADPMLNTVTNARR